MHGSLSLLLELSGLVAESVIGLAAAETGSMDHGSTGILLVLVLTCFCYFICIPSFTESLSESKSMSRLSSLPSKKASDGLSGSSPTKYRITLLAEVHWARLAIFLKLHHRASLLHFSTHRPGV